MSEPAAQKNPATKKKWKPIAAILIVLFLLAALVFAFLAPMAAINGMYTAYFSGRRMSPGEGLSGYPGLQLVETVQFRSNLGQYLTGHFFEQDSTTSPKGLIVLSHGIGDDRQGGCFNYLREIAAFTRRGYRVFAFDNTGYGESEGENRGGLPQAAVDLEFALLYLESREDLSGLPMMLYGHSWGGYAVCSVLNNDHEIQAAVSRCGFHRTQDMLVDLGSRIYGESLQEKAAYIYLYEHFKFGKVVDQTAAKGLQATDADVLVICGEDDDVIPFAHSIYRQVQTHDYGPNVQARLWEGSGHNDMTEEQLNGIVDFFDASFS